MNICIFFPRPMTKEELAAKVARAAHRRATWTGRIIRREDYEASDHSSPSPAARSLPTALPVKPQGHAP